MSNITLFRDRSKNEVVFSDNAEMFPGGRIPDCVTRRQWTRVTDAASVDRRYYADGVLAGGYRVIASGDGHAIYAWTIGGDGETFVYSKIGLRAAVNFVMAVAMQEADERQVALMEAAK